MYNWIYDWDNVWLYFVLLIFLVIIEIAMICCRKVSRTVPLNYILLLLFTLCESYIVSWICIYYTVYYDYELREYVVGSYDTVLMALGMTVAIVLAVTGYACTTKTDFTMKMGIVWIIGMAFMLFCLFTIFWYNRILEIVIGCIGTILFGIYLLIDTQLILGKGRYKLNIDDYILGALVLYLDIIMIFLYILQIFGSR
jgi:protein lifeguard